MDTSKLKIRPVRPPYAGRAGRRQAGLGVVRRRCRSARIFQRLSRSWKRAIGRPRGRVTERVAYIWFKLFCALRFMDVNRARASVSCRPSRPVPAEILLEADGPHRRRNESSPRRSSSWPICWRVRAPAMIRKARPTACWWWLPATPGIRPCPSLFERIDDYTELLMPGRPARQLHLGLHPRGHDAGRLASRWKSSAGCTSSTSPREEGCRLRGAEEEPEDRPDNIPAATQLFTRIGSRYLVDNSLGRLWGLFNRPGSPAGRADGLLHSPE